MQIRKIYFGATICACVCIFSCGGPANGPQDRKLTQPSHKSANKDIEAIRKTFESYRSAMISRDGEKAVQQVSAATIAMYQRFRNLALYGEENEVKQLQPGYRLPVLLLRHYLDLKMLMKLDGKHVFAHGVERDWFRLDSVEKAHIQKIVVYGMHAYAEISSNEVFSFVKEQGKWKLDLPPLMKLASEAIRQLAKRNNMSENDFLFSALSKMSGRKVTNDIWQPLGK